MGLFRIVAGLGNPGSDYHGTRHNIGFEVVDKLAEQHHAAWRHEPRWRACVAQIRPEPGSGAAFHLWLLKPMTYMNLSGEAIQAFTSYHKMGAEDLLVVSDDTALPLGRMRMRSSGSSGGHNGLASLEQSLRTQKYARLRCGIGRGDSQIPLHHFVLGRFTGTERAVVDSMVDRAGAAVQLACRQGLAVAMNEVNRVAESESPACN